MKIVKTAAMIAANAHTVITLMAMRTNMGWKRFSIRRKYEEEEGAGEYVLQGIC